MQLPAIKKLQPLELLQTIDVLLGLIRVQLIARVGSLRKAYGFFCRLLYPRAANMLKSKS